MAQLSQKQVMQHQTTTPGTIMTVETLMMALCKMPPKAVIQLQVFDHEDYSNSAAECFIEDVWFIPSDGAVTLAGVDPTAGWDDDDDIPMDEVPEFAAAIEKERKKLPATTTGYVEPDGFDERSCERV